MTLRRLLFHLHLYAGLTLGLLVVVTGLTGSLLVFRREIDAALNPALLRVRPQARRVSLQTVADTVRVSYPRSAVQQIFLAREPSEVHEIWLKGNAPHVYVDPYTGAIRGARLPEQTGLGLLFALHTEFLSGERGEIIALISAGLLVLMSATGIVLWWPSTRKLLGAALTVKWRASGKRVSYDLHRALGFYAAGLLCLSAVTGATFVPPFSDWFAGAVTAVTRTAPPAAPRVTVPSGADPLPLDEIARRADAALPGGKLTRIALPARPEAPFVVRKRLPDDLHPNGMSFVYVHPFTGQVLRVDSTRAPTPAARVMNLRYPLHIGLWGGSFTRVLYVLLGFMPLMLFVTGFLMWRNRTWGKRRRHNVPEGEGGEKFMENAKIAALAALFLIAASRLPAEEKRPDAKRKADPAAYALLKAAHDNRQTFGPDFPGLTADVLFNDEGRLHRGTLRYRPGEGRTGVTIGLDGAAPEAKAWLEGMVSNLLGHRRGGDFAKGDGQHPLTFGPDDHSPLGRLVLLNDALKSSYRVKDRIVTEVTRTMGDTRFTITVLETTPVEKGKYLPRHFVVTYFDRATGAIQRVQSYTDRYEKVAGIWLPTSRRVILADGGRMTTRIIELQNPRLLMAGASAL